MSIEGLLVAVIPAYEAAPSVGEIVRRTIEQNLEVIVVDDGSSDDTAAVAEAAGATVLSHDSNQGKGAALRTAFSRIAGRNFAGVVTLDADGQHLPEEIQKLEQAWREGADLVLGTRDHLFRDMSRVRQTSNSLSSQLISFAAGAQLSDVQTGFRIYSRDLLLAVEFVGDGFEAESAVVVRAARQGFEISAVPVELGFADGRCTSHYRPLVDSLRIAGGVIRARLEKVPHSAPVA